VLLLEREPVFLLFHVLTVEAVQIVASITLLFPSRPTSRLAASP